MSEAKSVSCARESAAWPRVLVLIVTYNAADYVEDCFASLGQTRYPAESFEILVVDNGSGDGTVEHIQRRWPRVKVLRQGKNLGFAGGNNVGLQYALDQPFDYVYLLNQDTVVSPDFLREAVAVAQSEPRAGAVQSKLLLHDEPARINSIGNELHYLGFGYAGGYYEPDRAMDVREIAYASGACVLLRTAALREAGLFYPDLFLYHEDLDLGWQLRLTGWRILLAPRSVVYHKYRYVPSLTKYYYMERNRRLTVLQNYRLATLALIAPAFLAMEIITLAHSMRAGFWREALRAWAYFLRPETWRRIAARRREVQRRRRVGDRDVARHFTGKVVFVELRSRALKYVVNPLFNAYWQIVRRVLWW
ncbi:MAG: glycosyltransferase family 2 protein [Candidatus Sumerlaeia bacterium]|nr:glycosyltransferase family 2 protein [Candidatus Sumerlaeia bacterium]